MPHGACHYVGLEVHDVGKQNAPLEPGVVFTVEPGVYELATGIGIRIEDVVVVTAGGCEVLSSGVPKDIEGVLALCAAKGLLDPAGD
jgi:Xaa-Pro aminopeptidase